MFFCSWYLKFTMDVSVSFLLMSKTACAQDASSVIVFFSDVPSKGLKKMVSTPVGWRDMASDPRIYPLVMSR